MTPLTFEDFIQKVQPIFGHYVWNCRAGVGSFITMEIGDPHLNAREPILTSRSKSLARRRVTIRGAWSIWICMCEWALSGPDVQIQWERDGSASDAAKALDGRVLHGLTVDGFIATFRFEGDVSLTTSPNAERDDYTLSMWSISDDEGDMTYALEYVHGLTEERSSGVALLAGP